MLEFSTNRSGLCAGSDKLERRWGRYGIPNLMNIILVGQLIAWVIVMVINQELLLCHHAEQDFFSERADLACCDLCLFRRCQRAFSCC